MKSRIAQLKGMLTKSVIENDTEKMSYQVRLLNYLRSNDKSHIAHNSGLGKK